MNPPRVYSCYHPEPPLPPPSPYHPSGSSQYTSPEHSASCIKPGLAIHFTYDNIHVSMPFSQIIPPSPSPRESKSLFYTSLSLMLSSLQGYRSVQFSHSVVSDLCDPMNRSTPGLPIHHQLPEFTQTHVHWVGDAIQPSHPLSSPSPPAPNPSQHQNLFQWVNSSHEVAKVLEFQL